MKVEVVVNGQSHPAPLRANELTDDRWHKKVEGSTHPNSIEFIRANPNGDLECITFEGQLSRWEPSRICRSSRFDPNPVSLTITYPAS